MRERGRERGGGGLKGVWVREVGIIKVVFLAVEQLMHAGRQVNVYRGCEGEKKEKKNHENISPATDAF